MMMGCGLRPSAWVSSHGKEHIIKLEPYQYESQAELITSIGGRVIAPAEAKVNECRSCRSP